MYDNSMAWPVNFERKIRRSANCIFNENGKFYQSAEKWEWKIDDLRIFAVEFSDHW